MATIHNEGEESQKEKLSSAEIQIHSCMQDNIYNDISQHPESSLNNVGLQKWCTTEALVLSAHFFSSFIQYLNSHTLFFQIHGGDKCRFIVN